MSDSCRKTGKEVRGEGGGSEIGRGGGGGGRERLFSLGGDPFLFSPLAS